MEKIDLLRGMAEHLGLDVNTVVVEPRKVELKVVDPKPNPRAVEDAMYEAGMRARTAAINRLREWIELGGVKYGTRTIGENEPCDTTEVSRLTEALAKILP